MAGGQKLLDINNNGDVFVKDGQGNLIRVSENGVLQGGANLGGTIQQFVFPVATQSTTSTSFIDLTGAPDQTLNTPVSGPHLIQMHVGARNNGSSADMDMQYVVDGGTGDEQLIPLQHVQLNSAAEWNQSTVSAVVTLPAGAHTIRPQWKTDSGVSINVHVSNPWYMDIMALGSGFNGLEIFDSTIGGDFALSIGAYNSTGHSVTFTALENERVEIKFVGRFTCSSDSDPIFAYRINGGADIPIHGEFAAIATDGTESLTFSLFTQELAAGATTIEFRAKLNTIGAAVIKGVSSLTDSRLQVVRYLTRQEQGGDIVEVYNDISVNGSISSGQTTFADIHGSLINQSPFSVNGGEYLVHWTGTGYISSGTLATIKFRLIFDEGQGNEQIIERGSGQRGWESRADSDFEHHRWHNMAAVTLTAGAHTVTAQWAYVSGSGTGTWTMDNNDPMALILMAASSTVAGGGSGSGGGSGRREIWQIEGGSNPPSQLTIGSDLAQIKVLSFDATVNEDVTFQVPVPDNADITVDMTVVLKYVMDTSNGGDVKLDLGYVIADLGDDIDPASQDVSLTNTFTPGAGVETLKTVSFTIASAQIPSLDAMFFARLTRDAVAGGDTHIGELQLLALELQYITV